MHRYAFDKRLVAFWGVFGVRPAKDGVTITDDGRLRATFGLLQLETPLDNVAGVVLTAGDVRSGAAQPQPARGEAHRSR